MAQDLKNKIIIVTGASEGIGAATAKYLAGRGATVVLAARSEDKLKKLAEALPGSLPIKADLRQPADIKKLIETVRQKFGRIDILINNAGQGLYSPTEKIDLDAFRSVMELNVYSVLALMQAVIPIMRTQGGGTIINISSAVTKNYFPGLAGYSATKYALNAISFTARQELAADNIRVAVVYPKMTATNFGRNSQGARPEWVQERMKNRSSDLVIDPPETVAAKIGELLNSEAAEIMV